MNELISCKTTLRGILVADEFNSEGQAIVYALLTNDEDKYRIVLEQNQQFNIEDFQRQKVRVYGETVIMDKFKIVYIESIVSESDLPYEQEQLDSTELLYENLSRLKK